MMRIKPDLTLDPDDPSLQLFIQSIEKNLEELRLAGFTDPLLPFVHWRRLERSISLTVVCSAENTAGAGRFINDIVSGSLVPGKSVPLPCSYAIAFTFEELPQKKLLFNKTIACLESDEDIPIAEASFQEIPKSILLNIESVRFARNVLLATTPSREKKALLESKMGMTIDDNIFESIQQLLNQPKAQNHVSQITEELPLFTRRESRAFSREIFNEIQQTILALNPTFILPRRGLIPRLIGYMHFFKDRFSKAESNPTDTLYIKLFRRKGAEGSFILGVLLSIFLSDPKDSFHPDHFQNLLEDLIPDARFVPNSCWMNQKERILTIFMEVSRDMPFSVDQLHFIREKLPVEVEKRIQRALHPLFEPINEEEQMKNLLVLSRELKYVHDQPQVMLHFLKQTNQSIHFTVVLVYLQRGSQIEVPYPILERRSLGPFRNRYQKEGLIFELDIEKKPFIRSDGFLDLFQARKRASSLLFSTIGPFRDFNGGLILKKSESLEHLRSLLEESSDCPAELTIQTYFHSIRPTFMQGTLPPTLLKELYLLLQGLLRQKEKKPTLSSDLSDDVLLIAMNINFDLFALQLQKPLEQITPLSSSLVTATLDLNGHSGVGLILYHPEPKLLERIQELFSALRNQNI